MARHAETDEFDSSAVELVDDAEPAARQEVQRKSLDTLRLHLQELACYDPIRIEVTSRDRVYAPVE
jgi:hypothetical protein